MTNLRLAALALASAYVALTAPAGAYAPVPLYPGARLDERHSTSLVKIYDTRVAYATVVAWYHERLPDDQITYSGNSISDYATAIFINPVGTHIDVHIDNAKPGFSLMRTVITFSHNS